MNEMKGAIMVHLIYLILSTMALTAFASVQSDFGESPPLLLKVLKVSETVKHLCIITSKNKGNESQSILRGGHELSAGQLPGERQRFRILGPTRTYTKSQSWIEVSYSDLTHNAGKVLYQLGPDVTPLAIVQGNGYGHGESHTSCMMHSSSSWFTFLEGGLGLKKSLKFLW